ncbi:MAG: DUF3343 domain-containing protein [Proteobacteria bacterium]|nr:DUF3343 domain-containing protein [Pseudomonadota bacterium]
MPHGVILFPSIHFALRAEKMTRGKGLSTKLIPVPRHLSSDCGVCLRIPWEDKEKILNILEAAGMKLEGTHFLSA